jgi:predicted nucleic acid-binding protein
MGRISEKLASHSIIGLDTSVFIYQLEAHPAYWPITQELLTGVQAGQWLAVTSTITVMELTVPAWQTDRESTAREYETLLANFPNLALEDVTRHVARRAAQLRARYKIRPADALQVASSLIYKATAFVTNDRGLSRLGETIDVIILDECLN